MLWPWKLALPVYNHVLAPVTRLVMLPFDSKVEVYADGASIKFVREIENIRDPQGRPYPHGLSLDSLRITVELPFLLLLFLLCPGLGWRKRLALAGVGWGVLFLSHVGIAWINAMAVSFQNGNLFVDLKTGMIKPKAPNPWHATVTHFQYTGPVLALLIWAAILEVDGQRVAPPAASEPTPEPERTSADAAADANVPAAEPAAPVKKTKKKRH